MERTTTIFIAGTTYSLTESAHEKLAAYLADLKAHFENDANRDEIVRDIESRISEKLMEDKARTITLADTEAIISEIGEPAQLDDEDAGVETDTKVHGEMRGYKKLYRKTDDAWLGGVASGIAAYFDINALWVRAAFVGSTLLWGVSILVYIGLWILVPEAKTPGQKLEMRGVNATLENISRLAKESTEEVRKTGIVKKFFNRIAKITFTIFKVFGKTIGIVLAILSSLAIIGLTIFFGAAITNWNTSFNDFPLHGAVPDGLLLFAATAVYLAILIPLLLLCVSGVRIMRKRALVHAPVVSVLVGTWVVVLVAGGIAGTNIARHYTETLAFDPQYQVTEQEVEIPAFSEINVTDADNVTIKKAPAHGVSIRAREINRGKINVAVENGVLTVAEDTSRKNCFFCEPSGAEIIVTTPDLEAISIDKGNVHFSDYASDERKLVVGMSGGSLRGELSVPSLEMTVERGYVRATIDTTTLTVNAKRARFVLNGSAKSAELYLVDSTFGDELFIIDTAQLDTQDSTVTSKILQETD